VKLCLPSSAYVFSFSSNMALTSLSRKPARERRDSHTDPATR
jgi:hypothetical protein